MRYACVHGVGFGLWLANLLTAHRQPRRLPRRVVPSQQVSIPCAACCVCPRSPFLRELLSRSPRPSSRSLQRVMLPRVRVSRCLIALLALAAWATWLDPLGWRGRAFPTGQTSDILFAARGSGAPSLDRLVVCSVSIIGSEAHHGNSAAQYRELTFRNHIAYCARHGYDYVLRTRASSSRVAQWTKLRLVQTLLQRGYPAVFWTDADAIFTRCSQSVEATLGLAMRPHADFFFTGDHAYAINTGQFLIRNSSWSHRFLDRWWDAGRDRPARGQRCCNGYDNRAAIAVLHSMVVGSRDCDRTSNLRRDRQNACLKECVQLFQRKTPMETADCEALMGRLDGAEAAHLHCLPQTAINSYYLGNWRPGHFRAHVAGGQAAKPTKLRLISWLYAPMLMC